MFCIIQGRIFRKYDPGQAFPGTPVSTPFLGFSLLYSYITSVSTVVFAIALFAIYFLFAVFFFMITSLQRFLFDLFASFNHVLSIEPSFILNHAIGSIQ